MNVFVLHLIFFSNNDMDWYGFTFTLYYYNLYKLLSMYTHGQLINIYYSDNISYVEEIMVAECVDP